MNLASVGEVLAGGRPADPPVELVGGAAIDGREGRDRREDRSLAYKLRL